MTKIILCGANGKMGHTIQNIINSKENCEIVAGVDINTTSLPFPVYENINDVKEHADVIIDFTNPSLLTQLLDFSISHSISAVIGTTGYSDEQKQMIIDASSKCPIFFTYNMSIGINLLTSLVKKAAQVLGSDYDIEIIEKHHNQKIDAPSGTALMLADAICDETGTDFNYKYNRHDEKQKRTKNEIGIHSVRGGTIVGEHEVIFAGRDEVITLSHSARSKEVFANGAVNAALFMADKTNGLYSMEDMIN